MDAVVSISTAGAAVIFDTCLLVHYKVQPQGLPERPCFNLLSMVKKDISLPPPSSALRYSTKIGRPGFSKLNAMALSSVVGDMWEM